MTKKALLVGINAYESAPLRGCVNDVLMVSEMLTKHYGFSTKNKRMLTDKSATTEAIRERLHWLVDGAKPGDTLYFHFSGHGSQMVDTKYDLDEEPDQLDEILCPVDLDWRTKVIKDDELKKIFDKVPAGVNLTVMLDCCHSGSGMDHMNQWQPLSSPYNYEVTTDDDPDARSRALVPPADILNRGLGLDIGVPPRTVQSRDVNAVGLMISGCQSHQTSADARIDGMFVGAATYSLVNTLKAHDYKLSYAELVQKMNEFMVQRRYTQRPELNGSTKYFNDDFFVEPDEAQTQEALEQIEDSKPSTGEQISATVTATIGKVKDNPKLLLGGIFVVAVGITLSIILG